MSNSGSPRHNHRSPESNSQSRSPKRNRSRSRSRDAEKMKNKFKELVMSDIDAQHQKLRECYSDVEEQEMPVFVWGKPQQEALNKLTLQGNNEQVIRNYFINQYKELIRTWQNNRQKMQRQGKADEQTYEEYLLKQQEFHAQQEKLRAFMRIEQGRQQPIDKFVKIVYTYKKKYKLDKSLIPIMKDPKKYLKELSKEQL